MLSIHNLNSNNEFSDLLNNNFVITINNWVKRGWGAQQQK